MSGTLFVLSINIYGSALFYSNWILGHIVQKKVINKQKELICHHFYKEWLFIRVSFEVWTIKIKKKTFLDDFSINFTSRWTLTNELMFYYEQK